MQLCMRDEAIRLNNSQKKPWGNAAVTENLPNETLFLVHKPCMFGHLK